MITVTRIADDEIGTLGFAIVIDKADSMEAFKNLIQRGANLWPDAPAEIKEFADKITNGQVLQDYRTQDTSMKKTFKLAMPLSSPEHCTHSWNLRDSKETACLEAYCLKCGTKANEELRKVLIDSL